MMLLDLPQFFKIQLRIQVSQEALLYLLSLEKVPCLRALVAVPLGLTSVTVPIKLSTAHCRPLSFHETMSPCGGGRLSY